MDAETQEIIEGYRDVIAGYRDVVERQKELLNRLLAERRMLNELQLVQADGDWPMDCFPIRGSAGDVR